MRLPYNKTFEADPDGKVSGVSKDSPSALWTLQMSHQTKKFPDPSGKRNIFMDNFYTRHTLAERVSAMSDDEIKITGTCRLNIINKRNAVGVKKAIELLVDKRRGSWALVRAYNPKVANVQSQLQQLIEKNYYLNKAARDAYRSYLLAYASHSQRDIFNVHELDLQAVGLAFGFMTPPRVDLAFSARGTSK
jgi:hypothetical protein